MSQCTAVAKRPETALVVSPHPFGVQGQVTLDCAAAPLLSGDTLAVYLARHGVEPDGQWVVWLGGLEVPQELWSRVRPKPGHLVQARKVVQNDLGSLVKLGATMWLAYNTFGLGGMAGGSFMTLSGAAGYMAAGAAYFGGSMLINKLTPKATAASNNRVTTTTNPSYALTGGRNTARPYEPMGLVLGEPYCLPDMAASAWTYYSGGEQYLWQLLHAGLNCASVNTIRIGQTAIGYYQDVSLHYTGFTSGNTGLPVFSAAVDTVAGALLDAPSGNGPWVTRTSSENTIRLAVDIEGLLTSVNAQTGAYETTDVFIVIEYRLVGAMTWLPFVGSNAFVTLTNSDSKPVRVSYERDVASGQYEVQARKSNANTTSSSQQNAITWTTLRSYQEDTGNYSGQARVGLNIRASGQLSGTVDQVNWMSTMKPCPYWNGSAWTTATNRSNGLSNPGALILLLCRGIYDDDGTLIAGLGYDDAQIDVEGLKAFMVHCAAHGFTFDYFLQETMAVGELIDAIAAAGMGVKSWHTGALGVIYFSDDDPVQDVLNMATNKAKSFAVEYDTQQTADEIEYQYFDRDRDNTWKSVRVLAPDVTTPTLTSRQKFMGVTTESHAAVLARFAMAQNVYQRKTVHCEQDLQHMTLRRGTVVALSHDLTQWGYGGRVKAAVKRENLLKYSEDISNAAWTKRNGMTVVTNSVTAPDGTTTADKIVVGSSIDAGVSQLVATTSALAGKTFTWSVWLWTDASQLPATSWSLFCYDSSFQQIHRLDFDLTAVATRYTFTFTFAAYVTQSSIVARFDSLDGAASGKYFYAWGAQLEQSSAATDYIPTTTSAANVVTLTLDDLVPATSPTGSTSRYIGLRLPGESQYRVFAVATFTGSSRTLSLDSNWPDGVALPGDATDNPAWDTVWIYDFKTTPGQKLRVSEIGPSGNMAGAKIALVPETDEFWTYVWDGTYTAPPNTSLLDTTLVVLSAVVTEKFLDVVGDFQRELTLNFTVRGTFVRAELWGSTSGGDLALVAISMGTQFVWESGRADVWTLEVRCYGLVTTATPYRFVHDIALPPDVTGLTYNDSTLTWTALSAGNVSGYKIKFHYGNNLDWGVANELHTGIITGSPYSMAVKPVGTVTLMVKAVEILLGLESANIAYVIVNLGDALVANVVESKDYAALGFPGTVTGGAVTGGVLQADQPDAFYIADAAQFYGLDGAAFYSDNYGAMEWVSGGFTPSTAADGSRMTAAWTLTGDSVAIAYRETGPGIFYSADLDSFYGADSDTFYSGAGDWAAWPGAIDAAQTEYQWRVSTAAGATSGTLSAFTASVDVPDLSMRLSDVAIASGGTRLTAAAGYFSVLQNVQLTLQGGSTATYLEVTDKSATLGPLIAAKNDARTGVAAIVDAYLQGY
jgi:hypothetical protein